MSLSLEPVGLYRGPFPDKFGLPRQPGLNPHIRGTIELFPRFSDPSAVRGLEGFDWIWVLWHFSRSAPSASLTVRPPALGGNTALGVFATRSPFRPCPIGLSCVRLEAVVTGNGPTRLMVQGADMADATPVLDIKPYLPFTDSHPMAREGFTDPAGWSHLRVRLPEHCPDGLSPEDLSAISTALESDPRPRYQKEPGRTYALRYRNVDVRFIFLEDGSVEVTGFQECP